MIRALRTLVKRVAGAVVELRAETHPETGVVLIEKRSLRSWTWSLNAVYPAAETDWPHSHGGTALNLMLRGGYSEHVWRGVPWHGGTFVCGVGAPAASIVRRPGHLRVVRFDEVHHLSDVLPGTLTLELHLGPPAPYEGPQ